MSAFDDELSAWVAERVTRFEEEAPASERWLAPYVRRDRALPLYLGWAEVFAITTGGELLRWDTESADRPARPLDDSLARRVALVAGARRYPPLARARPTRPPEALDCDACGGTGVVEGHPDVLCRCGGVGWVDDATTRADPRPAGLDKPG